MPIQYHPKIGTILICDFDSSFKHPEMVKRRPVIVISPQISQRPELCTVVALSTEAPRVKLSYHHELNIVLPPPWDKGPNWVKGDMVYSMGFHRLDLIRIGRDDNNKRVYDTTTLSAADLKEVRRCVLCALGLSALTKHLT
jgi:uncharacterized protein YifN (PemK superfamily)